MGILPRPLSSRSSSWSHRRRPPPSPLVPPPSLLPSFSTCDLGPHTECHGLLEHIQHVTSEAHPLKALGRFPEQIIEIAGGMQKGDAPWGARPS